MAEERDIDEAAAKAAIAQRKLDRFNALQARKAITGKLSKYQTGVCTLILRFA